MIQLTNYTGGTPVYVKPEAIVMIAATTYGYTSVAVGNTSVAVTETPAQVLALIP